MGGRAKCRQLLSPPSGILNEQTVNSFEQVAIGTPSYEPGFGMAVSNVLCDVASGSILDKWSQWQIILSTFLG